MRAHWIALTVFAASITGIVHAAESVTAPPATAASLMEKSLPTLENQTALMLKVSYAPGGATAAHRHNANTFVYVLEGSIVMQVAGSEEVTLVAGETFYEARSDIHSVSRNASQTEPATFLVFMIKDEGAPVSMPVE